MQFRHNKGGHYEEKKSLVLVAFTCYGTLWLPAETAAAQKTETKQETSAASRKWEVGRDKGEKTDSAKAEIERNERAMPLKEDCGR